MFLRNIVASVALPALAFITSTAATAIPDNIISDTDIKPGSKLPFPTYGQNDTNQNHCQSMKNLAPALDDYADLVMYFNRTTDEIAKDPNKYIGTGAPNTCTVMVIVNKRARLSICVPRDEKGLISAEDTRLSLKVFFMRCLKEDSEYLGGLAEIVSVKDDDLALDGPTRKDYLLIDRADMIPHDGNTAEAQIDQQSPKDPPPPPPPPPPPSPSPSPSPLSEADYDRQNHRAKL